ncbi:hypothetical protein ACWEQL_27035, partial [Kitasatospora sp. NPDC004240]
AALALAALGVGGGTGTVLDRTGPIGAAAVAALALWAAVPPDGTERPPRTRAARIAAARTTVLAAGSVVLAAVGDTPAWRGVAVAVLLIGYLLLLDAFGPQRRAPRPAHALAALAAAGMVLPVALAPTGAGEWSRPLALLGLIAAAVGAGLALRPGGHATGRPSGTAPVRE